MKTTNTFTFSRDSEPDMHGLCQPRTPTLTFIFPSDVGVTATQGLSFRTSHRDDVMAAVSMALLSCWRPCFSDHEAHFSVLARCSSSVRPFGFEPDNQPAISLGEKGTKDRRTNTDCYTESLLMHYPADCVVCNIDVPT